MEELQPIPSYEGRYSVTRDGRIWSYPKRGGSRAGLWLRPGLARGYLVVCLFDGVGGHRMQSVHRAVALAWLPNPLNLPEVNHLNGVRADPRLENLEWCTSSQNNLHAYATGLNPTARALDDQQLAALRADLASGMTQDAAAAKFGVTQATVSHIVNARVKYAAATPHHHQENACSS